MDMCHRDKLLCKVQTNRVEDSSLKLSETHIIVPLASHKAIDTTQSLEVVRVDEENNVLLIKGAVPGAKGETVVVKPSIKARAKAEG